MLFNDIRRVKKAVELSLLRKANVVSVGLGRKRVHKCQITDDLSIVVGVARKLPCAQLMQKDQAPSEVDGFPVDVVQMGNIKPFAIDPTKRYRPIFPGISVAHHDVTAGSIACFAKRDGVPVLLSNNHVLAATGVGIIGDECWQPGAFDHGSSADTVGHLLDFVPIKMGINPVDGNCSVMGSISKMVNKLAELFGRKHRMAVVTAQHIFNEVDAAICSVLVGWNNEIPEIGVPVGIENPVLGMEVQKFGRTTSYTKGVVDQTDVTVTVGYDAGQSAVFTGQIVMGPMSSGGDSGSAILDMNKNLVALLFAGSDQTTIASPMKRVFDLLRLSL